MQKEIEFRGSPSPMKVKSNQKNQNVIEGYALVFNKPSRNLGDFYEVIDPNALKETDFSDVRALVNHNQNLVVSRSTSGTLQLSVDDVGLKFRALVANTTYGRDLLENIRNGNIDECSFGFVLSKDGDAYSYDESRQMRRRQLNNIASIVDISFVTYPAYPDAKLIKPESEVNLNDKNLSDMTSEEYDRYKRKLKLELELM